MASDPRSFCDTQERPRCPVYWNARVAVSQASSLARMAAHLRAHSGTLLVYPQPFFYLS